MSDNETLAGDLLAWLEGHGLARYHEVMVQEDINLDTIIDLDDADFQELGVSIGHRKALRRAIDQLKSEGRAEEPAEEAQRRQLTVLFCDLAESTKMARRYDAEDLAAILKRYHDRCYEIIASWGGRPLGTQGDGVIACFGLPKAQENDAERCVRAALEMSDAIRKLEFEDGLKLHSRIGVATGRMFVRGAVEEPGNVVGETLNLAARLQDCAAHDTVVLSSTTKRLVEKSTRLEHMGEHSLKGFADPVQVWTVGGMLGISDKLENQSAAGHRLVGRDREIAELRRLWEETKAGNGQVAVISGDAGIGKSFVLDAVRKFVDQEDHVHVRYFSAPFYENSALYPVIAQLTHAAGFRDGDDAATRLAKLGQLFDGHGPKDLALLADLLSIDAGGALPTLDMTAAQKKQETFAVLQSQLLRFAEDKPVVILAEDAHWADPTSLEFLTASVSQNVPNHRIMLIVTHRPPFDLGWSDQPHMTKFPLGRLSRDHSREIIMRVLGNDSYPLEIVHDIIENADGVPLFVEELARSVADQIKGDRHAKVQLPSSLEDSLRGRLDRLSHGKSVVQTASVFGRRFYVSLLEPILQMDAERMATAIREPIDADIIVAADDKSSETMLFRHALVQQAAYQGLLRAQRKDLHARIAALLLEHRPGMAETEPETLARHLAGSGQYAEAIKFLIAAGMRATSRAGQIEASNHYHAALEHLAELPPSKERDAQEVLLQALLGGALMATRGFAAPDVYNAFARARELCLSQRDNPMYCAVLYGLFTVNAARSNKEEAVPLAQEALDTFGDSPVPTWALAANFTYGVSRFYLGDMDEAQRHFEKTVALYTEDQHGTLVEQFGDDLAEFSMSYLQWLHLQKGDIDVSVSYLERAEAIANKHNNKNGQVRSIAFWMGRMQELGDLEAVAARAPKVIDISMKQGYPYWASAGTIGLGWTMACTGQPDGIEMIRGSLGFFDMIGQKTPQPYWRSYLVAGLIRCGRRDEALQEADIAIALTTDGLDRFYRPGVLRLKGEALLLDPADPAEAERLFREARAVADGNSMFMHSFRAVLSLARLPQAQGRGGEIREDLAQAISWITATEDFADLAEAKALLAELSG